MTLYEYDRQIFSEGLHLFCGVDEAGRGPLAGPVYAAAVILPGDREISGLNDSKKLSEKKREALFGEIIASAVCYGVASAEVAEIDAMNILEASMLAMRRAVAMLDPVPELCLVDGDRMPGLDIPTCTVVRGDAVSACIAAASILAKVSRDRELLELNELYPLYRFDKHKGYPTKLHYEMLDAYGESPVHRQTFLRKWRMAREDAK